MCRVTDVLIGGHDSKNFYSVYTQVADTIRTIYNLDIRRDEEDVITIQATRNEFLCNTVRIIASTLTAIDMGRIRLEEMEQILEARKRRRADLTTPARGLALIKMKYVS